MDYKKFKAEVKDKWIKENSYKSQLMGNSIIPIKPDIGSYVKVFDLDIPEDVFKEEFDEIKKAYFSVIEKLDKHYKDSN